MEAIDWSKEHSLRKFFYEWARELDYPMPFAYERKLDKKELWILTDHPGIFIGKAGETVYRWQAKLQQMLGYKGWQIMFREVHGEFVNYIPPKKKVAKRIPAAKILDAIKQLEKSKEECIYCGWEMEGSVCNKHCGTGWGRCLEHAEGKPCENKVTEAEQEITKRPKRCLDCSELDLASLNCLMCCKTGDEITHKYAEIVADNCPLPKE